MMTKTLQGVIVALLLATTGQVSVALPPPEDLPEEVLRTEIITEARSPMNGELLSAAEYAELQAQLKESEYPPQVSSELRQQIFLLNLSRLWNLVNPFN